MNSFRCIILAFLSLVLSASGNTVTANFTSATTIPVTAASYTATGNNVSLSLGYTPTTGTTLTVVRNTGLGFIVGRFTNLSQGQVVTLAYNNDTFRFVANYYGGSGNDLVLQWADVQAFAWGSNSNGQLGNNSTTNSSVPVSVTTSGVLNGKTVIAISAGGTHSLALCSDGTIAAWGYNNVGQLGDSTTIDRSFPVAVNTSGVLNSKSVVAIAAGSMFSLALCSDGTIAAWGYNYTGELGNGGANFSTVPVAVNTTGVLNGKSVVAISAGGAHSLALCSDGTLTAWGYNYSGQLGNNSTTNSTVPVAINTFGVLNGRSVVAIVAGGDSYSLALCSDGMIAAWGYNVGGQLGNNSTANSSVPVAVDTSGVLNGKTVVAIFGGSVAKCTDGTLAAWGYNYSGQVGNGTTTNCKVPVSVDMSGVLWGKSVSAISSFSSHRLAVCSDGSVAAWGSNSKGQLGNSSTVDSAVPIMVSSSGVLSGKLSVAISAGQEHSMALAAFHVSSNSTLSALSVSGGTLLPAFSSSTTAYTVGLSAVAASVTVTPTVSEANATVRVNGAAVTSGTASAAIPLAAGVNTLTVSVTAQDGVTATSYVLTIDNSSYGVWKSSVFTNPADLGNAAVSGELVIPAHDGITNLMKYALALAPMSCGTGGLPSVSPQGGYLTLTYRQNKSASDVAYTVQASDSPNGTWTTASTVTSQSDQGAYTLVTVRDMVPLAGHPHRFMRLQVAR